MANENDILSLISENISEKLTSTIRSIIQEELTKSKGGRDEYLRHSKEFLSASEAAIFLKRKLSTLYKDVHLGKLPYHRSGARKLLFSRKELEEFVKQKKGKSASEIEDEVSKYIQLKNQK